MVKSSSAHFRLNEHFKEKTIDDRIVESVFSIVEVDEESISSTGDENDSSNNKKKKKVKLVQKQIDKVNLLNRIYIWILKFSSIYLSYIICLFHLSVKSEKKWMNSYKIHLK